MEYDWNDWRAKAKEEAGTEEAPVVLPDGAEVQAVARVAKAGKTGKNLDKITIKFVIVGGAYDGEFLWYTFNFPASGKAANFFIKTAELLGVTLEGVMAPATIAAGILAAKRQVTLLTELGEFKGEPTTNVRYINAPYEGDEVVEEGTTDVTTNVVTDEDLPF
jgi:hypothetical protein